ncbi:SET and MYND domain-containing protein 5-like isoform X1 [Asterias rubens]|uniref:SET and MYND domain-containing protein 5-like isoform X1 n=1 Tax=Asterias rubens TaxID=7604 RepID=UPI00145571BA|nr:SET and MYND domain-containing protein 5-like isoform X1 [Asterias rubens]
MAASSETCFDGGMLSHNNVKNAGVSTRYIDDVKGKGVFAATDFTTGNTLFTEDPLVSAQFLWNETYRYTACEFCMRSMETAQEMAQRLTGNSALVLPHPECCTVKREEHTVCPQCLIPYCGVECRDQARAQYHQVLCVGQAPPAPEHPLVILKEAWKTMHYPPETASITLVMKMIATIKQARNKDLVLSAFSQFCQKTRNEEQQLAHKLLGSQFQDQLDTLQSLLAGTLYEDCINQWFTAEGLRSLFALIGMNGQGVGTSSLSVYVHNCDALDISHDDRQSLDAFIDQLYVDIEQESGTFLNCEGSALYQLQSRCNHSCRPNAEVQFNANNSTLSVVALTDINKSEEICICYLDECSRERSRHSRQKILRENYLFLCGCVKCLEQYNDAEQTSSEEEEEEEADMQDGGGGAAMDT